MLDITGCAMSDGNVRTKVLLVFMTAVILCCILITARDERTAGLTSSTKVNRLDLRNDLPNFPNVSAK